MPDARDLRSTQKIRGQNASLGCIKKVSTNCSCIRATAEPNRTRWGCVFRSASIAQHWARSGPSQKTDPEAAQSSRFVAFRRPDYRLLRVRLAGRIGFWWAPGGHSRWPGNRFTLTQTLGLGKKESGQNQLTDPGRHKQIFILCATPPRDLSGRRET